MADTEKIFIGIEPEDGSVKKTFRQVEDEADKTGGRLSSIFGSSFAKVAAAAAAAGTAIVAAVASRKVIEAAIQTEDAINGAASALRSVGQASSESLDQVIAFADEIERTTVVSKETALELFSIGQAFFSTREEAQAATKAALDFAEGAGISAEEAIRRIGRTVKGSVADVSQFAPAIANLTKAQLEAGGAIEILQRRFEGFAQAQTKTFSGAVKQLTNSFNSLQSEIGQVITSSPFVRDAFLEIGKAISGATSDIGGFSEGRDVIADLTVRVVEFALTVNRVAGPILEVFFNVLTTGFKSIRLALLSWFKLFINTWSKVVSFVAEDSALAKNLKLLAQSTNEEWTASFNSLADSADSAFNTEISASIQNSLEDIKTFAQQTREEIAKTVDGDGDNSLGGSAEKAMGFFEAMKAGFKSIVPSVKQLGQTIASTIGQGISGAFVSFGRALATGQNALESFGKAALSTLGSLAIQIGQFFILAGIGATAIPLFGGNGAASIAAGVALTILGGVLQGIGGSQPNPTGAGGGMATGGADANPQTGVPDVDKRDERSLQVVIEGNVLDRRETGLEIVKVIQENLDEFGGAIRS